MSRFAYLAALPALALGTACSQPATTPLAELQSTYGSTSLQLYANGQVNVLLDVEGDGCPLISDDVVAHFDGVTMNVTRGGYDTTADGCYPVAFWISDVPTDTVGAYETSTGGSQIVIEDPSASWTVASTRMFANDFVIDNTAGTITWNDVATISTAELDPGATFTLANNVISFAPGIEVASVSAYAHPIPSTCDGPASCTVDLTGGRVFQSMPQQ